MSVKISELPVLDNLADNDILAGVDTSANITAKVTLGSLKQYIDTNTQYTAGTNIDITNNVVSAPNVYTKTETDNAIATEASLKENKANKVTGLSSSSTDTQYPSAKCVYDHVDGVKETILANVGEDIGEVNQSIEELQEENDELQSEVDSLSMIYNAFPTESGEGESLTLDGTAEVKFKKFDLKGNTSQSGTPTPSSPIPVNVVSGDNTITSCGRNLGNPNTLFDEMYNSGYTNPPTRTIVDNRNVINFSTYYSHNKPLYITKYKENTQYTFRLVAKTVDSTLRYLYIIVQYTDGTSSTTSIPNQGTSWDELRTVSTENKTIKDFYFSYSNAGYWYIDEDSFNIIEGNTTDYEPYQGTNYQVNLPVENLVPSPSFNKTWGISGSGDTRTITTSSAYKNRAEIVEVSPNTTYTISGDFSMMTNNYIRILMFDTLPNVGSTSTKYLYGLSPYTFTTDTNTQYIVLYNGENVETIVNNLQLEYGNKKNSFTPYGTTPIELCKIGEYQDRIFKSSGKNLFDKETITNGYYYDTSGNYVAVNETYVSDFIEVNANDSYTLQTSQSSSTKRVNYFDSNKTWLSQVNTNNTDYTFTTPNNTKYIRVSFNQLVNKDNIQIEEGTTATTYEPYGVGKWCLHKEIGKVVLDSTLSGIGATNFSNLYQIYTNILNIGYLAGGYCDNFKFNNDSRITDNNSANSWLSDNQCAFRLGNESARDRFYIKSSNFATANELKEYFNSNATIVYYALATPTNTEITYQPLIDQLNLLEKAISKDGQTNISQVNNDLGFVIYAEAIKSLENVLDRIELLES